MYFMDQCLLDLPKLLLECDDDELEELCELWLPKPELEDDALELLPDDEWLPKPPEPTGFEASLVLNDRCECVAPLRLLLLAVCTGVDSVPVGCAL